MTVRHVLLAIAMAVATANAYAACNLTPIAVKGSMADIGSIVLDFGEPDNPQHPMAWQGPLKISVPSRQSCLVSNDVAIIEQPILAGKTVIYVPTYSGSQNRLYAVDIKTCRILWESNEYTDKAHYQRGKLMIGSHRVNIKNNCLP